MIKMSFVRTFLKVILTILLVFSLILLIANFSFFSLTSYSSFQPKLGSLIEQGLYSGLSSVNEQEFAVLKVQLLVNCTNKTEISVPFNGGDDGLGNVQEITFKCSEINENTTLYELVSLASKSIVDKIYYKEYNCDFISCLQNPGSDTDKMAVFASKTANDFFKTNTIALFILSLVLILGIILLSKPKYTLFYNLSVAFLVSGIPFIVKFLVNSSISGAPSQVNSLIASVVDSIFINYLIIFILGFVFLILAIIFKVKSKK